MNFEEIDIKKHRDTVVAFRKDSFYVSFGDTTGFGDEKEYLHWLDEKVSTFPKGFILVEEDVNISGNLN
ncbi:MULTISPECIES: hypothetical protein [unclassified Mesobacillus]|uniref:hypothetical protein n=1 Tax=unclassified Mesobacillus TaxID=2675270 RepID=UPI0033403ECA